MKKMVLESMEKCDNTFYNIHLLRIIEISKSGNLGDCMISCLRIPRNYFLDTGSNLSNRCCFKNTQNVQFGRPYHQ